MDLAKCIREVPDFPIKGIRFKDITTLIKDPAAFKCAIDALTTPYQDKKIDLVAAIESRGFIFGAPIAYQLGAGLVVIRKEGKLPAATIRTEYSLEYGTNVVEIHQDAIKPGQRVLVVDDLLATGGSASATVELVEKLGGKVAGIAFLIELTDLKGREKLKGHEVFSLVEFDI